MNQIQVSNLEDILDILPEATTHVIARRSAGGAWTVKYAGDRPQVRAASWINFKWSCKRQGLDHTMCEWVTE